jgi:flagellar biosynthetic protein FlhB
MSDERIFEPTPQRVAQARREGRVARSASLTTVVALLSSCLALWWYGAHIVDSLGWFLRQQLACEADLQLTVTQVEQLSTSTSLWLGQLLLPIFGCVFLTAIVANLSQGGFVWAPQRVVPDLGRLGPARRLTTMVAPERLLDVAIEFVKMSLCLTVAAVGLWTNREHLVVGHEEVYRSFAGATECIFRVLFQTLAVLGVISLLEYWLVHWRFRRSLRMTAEEWQAEMKERESTMRVSRLRRFATGDASADGE